MTQDPKGNKISRWSVSGAEMNGMNNVYQQEQVMSTEPVLGDWKLKAKLLSHNVSTGYPGYRIQRTCAVSLYRNGPVCNQKLI